MYVDLDVQHTTFAAAAAPDLSQQQCEGLWPGWFHIDYLECSGGKDGEALLGRQDADEPDDEQLHGDALQGGVQRHVVGQQADGAVHVSHAVQPCCAGVQSPSARSPWHFSIAAVST